MKKYYFGLVVLAILTVLATAITLTNANNAKRDEETSKKAESISMNLSEYLYQQNKVPATLAEAGITDVPSTITYQQLDSTRFKFCVYYDRASSSFDAGPLAFITGATYNAPVTGSDDEQEQSYLDTYSFSFIHKKGNNCQTVKPMLTTQSLDDFSNTTLSN